MLTDNIPFTPLMVLAILSFTCSVYVILTTLIPIMPPHPLSRRLPRQAFGLAKRSLTPAQRATLYIAACDILALAAFLWEAVAEMMSNQPLNANSSAGAAGRLWIALTARQSCLLVVATLTLLHLRSGKTPTFGMNDFYVWGPTVSLVIISTACACGLSTAHTGSFFYGTLVYSSVVAVASTLAFGLLLYYLLRIRKHLAAAALEREEWPPMTQKKRIGSFATEDIDALKDGSSWLTSVRSERTHSTSAFSFSTTVSSAAAPSSSANPYSNSIPAKSSFWFGPASTPNLHNGLPSSEPVPPVPELPREYKRTSSPLGVETDPFRREVPKSTGVGSQNSWLTEPSGSVSTPTQFSFPTTRPSSPAASTHDRFEDVPLDLPATDRLSTPVTPTAFEPSPRASRDQWYPKSSGEDLVKPKVVLGGYGPHPPIPDAEKAALDECNAGAENLAPWRMFGWFLSIWVPLVCALPYIAMQCVPSPISTSAPFIFLTLSVTLSSPILAVHVFCSAGPVPVIPPELFAPAAGRADLMGSISTTTVSSGPALPADMVPRSASQMTFVPGRRSGDIWIEKGYASDNDSKLSRILGMAAPSPRLFSLDPPAPSSESIGGRTLTNPTPEPGAQPASVTIGAQYDSDPVIEAASKILAQQAANKAERARFESKGSSYYSETFKAQIMVAEKHYSSVAPASLIAITRSNPTSPTLQANFQPTVLETIADASDPAPTNATSTSVAKRHSFASGHVRNRSSVSGHGRSHSSASSKTSHSLAVKPLSVRNVPLTPPPAFPLPPTPDSKPSSIFRHARSQSHASTLATPRSTGSAGRDFDILSARFLPSILPELQGEDIRIRRDWSGGIAGPEFSFGNGNGMDSLPQKFITLDESEMEELMRNAAASSTPKSTKLSKMGSISDSLRALGFSSPETHSTPKKLCKSKRHHLSLPSLGLKRGQPWKDEITSALQEFGILANDDDSRRRMILSTDSPACSSPALDSRWVLPPPVSLPTPHALSVEPHELMITPLPSDNFIVPHPDGTPLAMAVPQASQYEVQRPSITSEQPRKHSSVIYIKSSDSAHAQPDLIYPTSANTQDKEQPPSITFVPQAWPPIPTAGVSAPVAEPANYSLPTGRMSALLEAASPNQDSDLPSKSPFRPLSLLQGRNPNTPKDSSMSVTDKKTLPLNTPKRSMKSTTSSGTSTTEKKKSKKSTTSSQFQDENRIEEDMPDTPVSGLRPLRLARSATSKARGILRKQEVLPDVFVRPPSTSTHQGFSYSFRRGVA
ncbi:uncharacterized protein EI90DRAFT_3150614 [Cantharellus anzutake]|uniref:uncharacterized protein n=1 Tax=Cantharellus anzutake TaxID=1750568 RepID=UPI00190672A5|nr:uncharacterized protein EI90DRAFT_3150614 [Cantharellus anzutake]KAF8341527.1 hypothetical protein EI90DRAFT_3150614 [Cantharellus anzutake]